MKQKERFFSRSRKNKPEPMGGAPAFAQPPVAEKGSVPAAETVVTGHALLFTGAPEAMPIVDDQLFLSVPPQGGLVISPKCVGTPLLVIWKSGEDWLVRRLCQEKLLYNGYETVGDEPILLWGGACLEVVGRSAFTFLEIHGPVKKEEPAVQPAPAEEVPPAKEEAPAVAEEPAPFDWTPFFPADEPETVEAAVPAEEPEVTEEPVPVAVPEVTEEPIPVVEPEVIEEPAPFDWTPFFPADEPETVEADAPAEEPEVIEEPVPVAEPEVIEEPVPVAEPEVIEEPVPVAEPEVIEEPIPVAEPEVTEEPAPFDWTPFFPVAEPEIIEDPAPVEVPVGLEAPVLPEPVTPRDALVLALEQLAVGDWEALQCLPGLLAQVDLYCWGGFNFQGVYFQPIPAVRPADWSGDADSLDELGWEPRPGMVIPVFTREEEAVKRNCPLGAFPSSSAAALFARFAEMGLDLEVDPFGERPVWVPAGAVRALSEALGGGTEKFRWIRRTLPW